MVDGAIKASGTADSSGKYAVSAKLPDGASDVAITTADRAGNATTKNLHVFVDAQPPVLKVTSLDRTMKKAGISVRVKATDQLGVPTVKFVLDDEQRDLTGPASKAKFKAANLAQGKHVMVVTAADKGGNVVTKKQVFVVDSTEHFGSATMWPGARGKDVKELQAKLVDAGVYSGKKTGVYDSDTEVAVRKLQAKYGLEVDGIVGGNVLNALSGQIVVDIGDLRLYLYRDGVLVKSYQVATGQPAYPTPTGTYSIVNMTKDPTWLPPNSDWAKDAQAHPAGHREPAGHPLDGDQRTGRGHPRRAAERRRLHRHLRLSRLHPHAQLGRGRPLRPRRHRHAGHHPPVESRARGAPSLSSPGSPAAGGPGDTPLYLPHA